MKTGGSFLALFLAASVLFAPVAAQAQETMTIVTYYPSPLGVYRVVRVLNDNEEIRIGDDTASPGIILIDDGTDGGVPYIDFDVDSGGTDFAVRAVGPDRLEIRGGVTEFLNDDGSRARIIVGETYFCP